MKVKIEKSALLSLLKSAHGPAPTRAVLPVLTSVRLEACSKMDGGQWIEATETDLEITQAATSNDLEVETPGALCVPASLLLSTIQGMPSGMVTLSADDRHRLRVRRGGVSATLAGEEAAAFPHVEEAPPARSQVRSGVLARMIALTQHAISTDDARASLMGAFLRSSDGEVSMTATDGHRLARVVEVDSSLWVAGDACPGDLQQGVIIPRKALTLISRVLSRVDVVDLSLAQDEIIIDAGDVSVRARLIPGRFPDVSRVIPADLPDGFVVGRAALQAALKRAGVHAPASSHVRLSLSDGALDVEAASDAGSSSETLHVVGDGAISIGFNHRYLQDVLSLCTSDEIRIRAQSTEAPVIIEDDALDGVTFIVMPMQF